MNNDDLVQNYFLKNIYNSLHDLYNHITEYITSDNSNLDNFNNQFLKFDNSRFKQT